MQTLMAELIASETFDSEILYLVLNSPELAGSAKPGQFVHISCTESDSPLRHDPLLRRPISIASVDRRAGQIGLLIRVAGRGTRILQRVRDSEFLNLIGPLGSPFPFPENGAQALLVGGGIGVAPLFFLAQDLRAEGIGITTILGARTGRGLLFKERFAGFGALLTATEDGSYGTQGYVTSRLDEALKRSRTRLSNGHSADGVQEATGIYETAGGQGPVVYTCGPKAMMAEVVQFCRQEGLQVWVSLEEHMACGVGACLVCACKVQGHYRRVCFDGPVFDGREVDWDA